MTEICSTKCCGVGELNNLGHSDNWGAMLVKLRDRLKLGYDHWGTHYPYGSITFTGVDGTRRAVTDHSSGRRDDYGRAFAEFLTKNELGKITEGPTFQNWTKNYITVWMWQPDYPALWAFIEKNTPAKQEKLDLTVGTTLTINEIHVSSFNELKNG